MVLSRYADGRCSGVGLRPLRKGPESGGRNNGFGSTGCGRIGLSGRAVRRAAGVSVHGLLWAGLGCGFLRKARNPTKGLRFRFDEGTGVSGRKGNRTRLCWNARRQNRILFRDRYLCTGVGRILPGTRTDMENDGRNPVISLRGGVIRDESRSTSR